MSTTFIYGKNSLFEWLAAGLQVEEIWLSRELNRKAAAEIRAAVSGKKVPLHFTDRSELSRMLKHDRHQGVAARIHPVSRAGLEDIFAAAAAKDEDPLIAVLDGVQDPHNLGAIIRSADGAGLHGIIVPKDNAVGLTPAVLKASAGAAVHVPLVQVTNLARIMKVLKDRGVWITGAAGKAEKTYTDGDYSGPTALVLGSEGKGIRPLISRSCDFLVSIPMHGKVNSLNVSVAAALLFFAARQQRGK